MSASPTVKAYLGREQVHDDMLPSPETLRAAEIARMPQTAENDAATVVFVKVDERLVMVVSPAGRNVDVHRWRTVFAAPEVRLATEEEITRLFPDRELGAMPAFGHFYGLPGHVDHSSAEDEEFVVQAGARAGAIRMRYRDFPAPAFPAVEEFLVHPHTSGDV